jgi:hypothetical protein
VSSARAHVGPESRYDTVSANQFNVLTFLGLRERHYLVDIGCGSLRAGRLLIPYLLPGHYYGIEPEKWVVEAGIKSEIGDDMVRLRTPTFSNDDNFTVSEFGRKFDFLLAHGIFIHTSKKQLRRCLDEAEGAMHDDSVFAATFLEGVEDYAGDAWAKDRMITYTYATVAGEAEEHGLRCQKLAWWHPSGQTWTVMTTKNSRLELPRPDDFQAVRLMMQERDEYKRRLENLRKGWLARMLEKI